MQGIYEIVNQADGKASSYVGSSTDIARRFRKHRYKLSKGIHYNPHLQASWDKYGEGAFAFSALEEVAGNKAELLMLEREYIEDYLDRGACFNLAKDALAPMAGRRHTEVTKRKMRESALARDQSNYGHPISQELMQKLRAVNTDNEYTAAGYPAFYNMNTGEHIPPGYNLAKLCRCLRVSDGAMCNVKNGKWRAHKGWVLANGGREENKAKDKQLGVKLVCSLDKEDWQQHFSFDGKILCGIQPTDYIGVGIDYVWLLGALEDSLGERTLNYAICDQCERLAREHPRLAWGILGQKERS